MIGALSFPLFQSEHRGFDRLRIAAVLLHHAEVAIFGGGGLVVGKFARQLAKIGATLDLLRQILDFGFRFRFGDHLLAIRGRLPGRGIERNVDDPDFHFLEFVRIVFVVLLLIFLA